jgi:hypothetical protein
MSIFRTIRGMAIRSYAGDPANPITGQIWYNSVLQKLRARNNSATVTITTST